MGRSLARRHGAVRVVAVMLIGVPLAAMASMPDAATAAACAGSRAPVAALSPAERRAAIRCLVNRRRAAAGLDPVELDPGLARAARGHTGHMVRRRFFAHVAPDGRRVGDRLRSARVRFAKAGEVLAWACGRATPQAAIEAWLDSPSHRAVILDGAYTRMGVGSAPRAPVPCRNGATWTVVFARPL